MIARITVHTLLALALLVPRAASGEEPETFVETKEMMQPDPDVPRTVVAADQLRRSLEAGRDALLNADAHGAFMHLNKALYLSKMGEAALNWQISDYKMQDEIQHGTAVGGVIPPTEDSILADILFEIEQADPLAGKKLDQDALFVAGQEAITTGYQRDVQAREKAQDMKERGKKLKDRQSELVEKAKTLYVAAGGKGGGASSGQDDGSDGDDPGGVKVVNTSAEGGGGGGGSDEAPPDGKRPPGDDSKKTDDAAGGKGGGGGGSPSGTSKAGGESGRQEGEGSKSSGEPSGDGKGGGDGLAGQQEEVAKAAHKMASAAHGLSGIDSRFGAMSDQLGEAAERAFEAAGEMRAGDKAAGLRKAEETLEHMKKAMEGLDPIILERLAANLKALQLTARELYQRQGSLRRKTDKLVDLVGEMSAAALQRDAEVQRIAQVRIHKGLGELATYINEAAAAAAEMERTAAVKALRSAQRTALRGPEGADQKMRNAVVRLEQVQFDAAADEMIGAEEALKAFLEDITAAGLDLTPGSAAAIARAEMEAGRIGRGLSALAGKPYAGGKAQAGDGKGDGMGDGKGAGESSAGDGKGDGKGAGESQAGDGKGDGKGAGESQAGDGKGDGKGSGSESGSGEGAGKGGQGDAGSGRDDSDPEHVKVTSASGGKGGAGLGQPDGSATPLTGKERERAASRLAFRIKSWVWEMKDVELVPEERLAALEDAIADGVGLEARLDADSAEALEIMEMVADVHTYLAQLRQSRADATRLKAARREECPPAYRPLVSEYFKALASPDAR
jgi:hypothetical protein